MSSAYRNVHERVSQVPHTSARQVTGRVIYSEKHLLQKVASRTDELVHRDHQDPHRPSTNHSSGDVGRLYPVELCRKMPLMVLHCECESFSVCSPMLIFCLLMVTFGPCRAKPLDAWAQKWWCLVMLHALVHPAAGKLVQPLRQMSLQALCSCARASPNGMGGRCWGCFLVPWAVVYRAGCACVDALHNRRIEVQYNV